MYGIRLRNNILCVTGSIPIRTFVPMDIAKRPLLRYSQIEIDELLQEMTVDYNDYTMVVHKFTEEELEQFTFNRLKK